MRPGRGKETPGSIPEREAALEGRLAGLRPGSNTCAPSPPTEHRVTTCSAEDARGLTLQMRSLGAPSPHSQERRWPPLK